LQGIERRSYGPGRRATDRQGARSAPWARILALAVAIALVAYALLVLREADRPRREAEAARIEALSLEARLAASQVESQANRAALALRAGARALNQTPGQPAAALDHARGLAPEAAFMIVDPQGRILAASGARLSAPAAAISAVQLGEDGMTQSVTTGDGVVLLARTPLPELKPSLKNVALSVMPAGQTPAEPGRAVKGPDGQARSAAVAPIGDTGLSVVAALPRADGLAAWLEDAWMLAGPLLLVVLMLAVIAVQNSRQMRAGRRWAETERRFRVAVEAARCGIWEWDIGRGEMVLSDYMAALLEVEEGSRLTTQALIERVHPSYREVLHQALDEAALNGAFEAAFPIPLKSGGVRWIDVRGQSRQPRRDGVFVSLMGVALDVTDARRTKAQPKVGCATRSRACRTPSFCSTGVAA